jgi:hypothetical protein
MTYLLTVFPNLALVKKCAGEQWDVKRWVVKKNKRFVRTS